jgi:hypothetical protein
VNKSLPLALSLAGIALAASACSPGVVSPGPGTAVSASTAAPSSPAKSTGWELSAKGGADRIKAAGLRVLKAEGAAEHFHTHLDVFVNGQPVSVPAEIGFELDASTRPTGISALHSHDRSGVIHVEAPTAGDTYTLGQVLTEWGVLDGTDTTPGTAHSTAQGWSVAVNGIKQDALIPDVVLKAHDEIVLWYGTAPDPLPATFAFPEGL